MHVVIAGGTGFLGRSLIPHLVEQGDRITVLSRQRHPSAESVDVVVWDSRTLGPWVSALEGADAVVHLTGKRVDCRPTKRNIAELVRSRVAPVRLVGEGLAQVNNPPPVWVQSSTLAIYGEGGDAVLDESVLPSGVGPPQMVQVALAWEQAFAQATATVERAVLLRIGVGIGGDDDPATSRLLQLARFGLGGAVGGGQQWMSWVAVPDLMRAMVSAVHNDQMRGLYHLTSPHPVTNRQMMSTVRAHAGRTFGLPSPAWLTRLGAPMLGSDPDLALTGRRVVPTRLLAEGFEFSVPTFDEAFSQAVQGEHGS